MDEKKLNDSPAEEKDHSFLKDLSDDELEELLDASVECAPEDVDADMICAIMDELADRGYNEMDKEEPDPDLDAALARFWRAVEEDEKKQEAIKRAHLWRNTSAVAVVVIIVIAVSLFSVSSADADSYGFWNKVVDWTKETFHIGDGEPTEDTIVNIQANTAELFLDLKFALVANEITTVALPTWAPEGYEQVELKSQDLDLAKSIEAWYQNDDKKFSILIRSITENFSAQGDVEQNETKERIYKLGGIEHHINLNEEDGVTNTAAYWEIDGMSVRIQGSLTNDEIVRMVESIYERQGV